MPYLIYAIDHEQMDSQRESIRNEHRRYLKSYGDKILASGALLSEDQEEVIGGITLLDVETLEEAEVFGKEDPYTKANIRRNVNILYWRKRWWNGQFLLNDVAVGD
jgi:uncharacterized protein YciI